MDLTQAVELFLTMFTTLANVHGPELSLKPMIALCFSRNKAVQLAKPVAVLRYLAVNGKGVSLLSSLLLAGRTLTRAGNS